MVGAELAEEVARYAAFPALVSGNLCLAVAVSYT
jgi:hypothetical protein